jgi:hypothetical protein
MHNIHPSIVAWLGTGYGKEWLDKFDAANQINATPRSWEAASNVMHCLEKVSTSLMKTGLFGCIGNEATLKFVAWMKYYEKMPDLQKILSGKDIYPDELDVMYATVSGLVSLVKEFANTKKAGVVQRLVDYAVNLPDKYTELGALLSKDLLLVAGEDAFMNANLESWGKRYPHLIVGEN